MIKAGFEPTCPVSEWVCDRARAVIGPGHRVIKLKADKMRWEFNNDENDDKFL